MSSWTPEMAQRAREIIADEVSYARHEPTDLLEAALERIAGLEQQCAELEVRNRGMRQTLFDVANAL